MDRRSAQIWFRFPDQVTAISRQEALYVQSFCCAVANSGLYLHFMELHDLQHYRIVRKTGILRNMLSRHPKDQYFLFPFYLN